MISMIGKRTLAQKVIALLVCSAMFFNDFAFAFEKTAPGDSATLAAALRLSDDRFKEESVAKYLGVSAARFVRKLHVLKRLGVSPEGLQREFEKRRTAWVDNVLPKLHRNFPAAFIDRFKFEELSWDGENLILPYHGPDGIKPVSILPSTSPNQPAPADVPSTPATLPPMSTTVSDHETPVQDSDTDQEPGKLSGKEPAETTETKEAREYYERIAIAIRSFWHEDAYKRQFIGAFQGLYGITVRLEMDVLSEVEKKWLNELGGRIWDWGQNLVTAHKEAVAMAEHKIPADYAKAKDWYDALIGLYGAVTTGWSEYKEHFKDPANMAVDDRKVFELNISSAEKCFTRMESMLREQIMFALGRIDKEAVDIDSVIDEAAAIANKIRGERHEKGAAKVTGEKLSNVTGTRNGLFTMAINIISNAMRFADKTDPAVTINKRVEGRFNVIEISDNGQGMMAEQVSKLGYGVSSKGPGGGIGVAESRLIAGDHGGSIEIISRHISGHPNDHGTTFVIRLPIAPAAAAGPGKLMLIALLASAIALDFIFGLGGTAGATTAAIAGIVALSNNPNPLKTNGEDAGNVYDAQEAMNMLGLPRTMALFIDNAKSEKTGPDRAEITLGGKKIIVFEDVRGRRYVPESSVFILKEIFKTPELGTAPGDSDTAEDIPLDGAVFEKTTKKNGFFFFGFEHDGPISRKIWANMHYRTPADTRVRFSLVYRHNMPVGFKGQWLVKAEAVSNGNIEKIDKKVKDSIMAVRYFMFGSNDTCLEQICLDPEEYLKYWMLNGVFNDRGVEPLKRPYSYKKTLGYSRNLMIGSSAEKGVYVSTPLPNFKPGEELEITPVFMTAPIKGTQPQWLIQVRGQSGEVMLRPVLTGTRLVPIELANGTKKTEAVSDTKVSEWETKLSPEMGVQSRLKAIAKELDAIKTLDDKVRMYVLAKELEKMEKKTSSAEPLKKEAYAALERALARLLELELPTIEVRGSDANGARLALVQAAHGKDFGSSGKEILVEATMTRGQGGNWFVEIYYHKNGLRSALHLAIPKPYTDSHAPDNKHASYKNVVIKVERDINHGQIISIYSASEYYRLTSKPRPINTYIYSPTAIRHYLDECRPGVMLQADLADLDIRSCWLGYGVKDAKRVAEISLHMDHNYKRVAARLHRSITQLPFTKDGINIELEPFAYEVFLKAGAPKTIYARIKRDPDYGQYIELYRDDIVYGTSLYLKEREGSTLVDLRKMAFLDYISGNLNTRGEPIVPRGEYEFSTPVHKDGSAAVIYKNRYVRTLYMLRDLVGKNPIFVPVRNEKHGYVFYVYDAKAYRADKDISPAAILVRGLPGKPMRRLPDEELASDISYRLLLLGNAINHGDKAEAEGITQSFERELEGFAKIEKSAKVETLFTTLTGLFDAGYSSALSANINLAVLHLFTELRILDNLPRDYYYSDTLPEDESGRKGIEGLTPKIRMMTLFFIKASSIIISYNGPHKESLTRALGELVRSTNSDGVLFKPWKNGNSPEQDDAMQSLMQKLHTDPYRTLTRPGELILAIRYRLGDESALVQLTNSNLPLVAKIANDFKGALPPSDLIAEGASGMQLKLEEFDPSLGNSVCTYIAWWIKNSMRIAIRKQAKTVRIPAHARDLVSKVRARLGSDMHELSAPELEANLSLPTRTARGIKAATRNTISFDDPALSEDGDAKLHEVISLEDSEAYDGKEEPEEHTWDEANAILEEATANCRKKWGSDAGRYMKAVNLSILWQKPGQKGKKRTLEEVAAIVNLSREWVRQISIEFMDEVKRVRIQRQKERDEPEEIVLDPVSILPYMSSEAKSAASISSAPVTAPAVKPAPTAAMPAPRRILSAAAVKRLSALQKLHNMVSYPTPNALLQDPGARIRTTAQVHNILNELAGEGMFRDLISCFSDMVQAKKDNLRLAVIEEFFLLFNKYKKNPEVRKFFTKQFRPIDAKIARMQMDAELMPGDFAEGKIAEAPILIEAEEEATSTKITAVLPLWKRILPGKSDKYIALNIAPVYEETGFGLVKYLSYLKDHDEGRKGWVTAAGLLFSNRMISAVIAALSFIYLPLIAPYIIIPFAAVNSLIFAFMHENKTPGQFFARFSAGLIFNAAAVSVPFMMSYFPDVLTTQRGLSIAAIAGAAGSVALAVGVHYQWNVWAPFKYQASLNGGQVDAQKERISQFTAELARLKYDPVQIDALSKRLSEGDIDRYLTSNNRFDIFRLLKNGYAYLVRDDGTYLVTLRRTPVIGAVTGGKAAEHLSFDIFNLEKTIGGNKLIHIGYRDLDVKQGLKEAFGSASIQRFTEVPVFNAATSALFKTIGLIQPAERSIKRRLEGFWIDESYRGRGFGSIINTISLDAIYADYPEVNSLIITNLGTDSTEWHVRHGARQLERNSIIYDGNFFSQRGEHFTYYKKSGLETAFNQTVPDKQPNATIRLLTYLPPLNWIYKLIGPEMYSFHIAPFVECLFVLAPWALGYDTTMQTVGISMALFVAAHFFNSFDGLGKALARRDWKRASQIAAKELAPAIIIAILTTLSTYKTSLLPLVLVNLFYHIMVIIIPRIFFTNAATELDAAMARATSGLGRSPLMLGWATPGSFIHAFPDKEYPIHAQGWKLHIAAVAEEAPEVISIVRKVLESEGVKTWKILGTIEDVKRQNRLGEPQSGKVICVYFEQIVDDYASGTRAIAAINEAGREMVAIAQKIDGALMTSGRVFTAPPGLPWNLQGDHGDKLLRDAKSGLMGYRFGPFSIDESLKEYGPYVVLPNGAIRADSHRSFKPLDYADPDAAPEPADAALPKNEFDMDDSFKPVTAPAAAPYSTTFIERAFDIAGALIMLPAAAVVTLLSAPFIFFTDRKIIFTQQRVGRNGKIFTIYKLSTMLHKKVTSIGKILRPIALDELPQVWNVLKGDMSIFGPRPDSPDLVDGVLIKNVFYRKPGFFNCLSAITGPGAGPQHKELRLIVSEYEKSHFTIGLRIKMVLAVLHSIFFREKVEERIRFLGFDRADTDKILGLVMFKNQLKLSRVVNIAAITLSVLAMAAAAIMPGYFNNLLTFPIYYTLLGLIGNFLASRFDEDKHWGRFVVFGLITAVASMGYIPLYVNISWLVPDYGIWSHSLRAFSDIFVFAQPLNLLHVVAQGVRQKMEKKHLGDMTSMEWRKDTSDYAIKKTVMFYSHGGMFMVITLFWFPILHFIYYFSQSQYLSIAGAISPVFAIVSAVFMVQKPGKKLTPNPTVDKILKYSYFGPLAALPVIAIFAYILGYPDFALNAVAGIVNTGIGYAVYRLVLVPPINYALGRLGKSKESGAVIAGGESAASSGCIYSPEGPKKAIIQMAESVKRGEAKDARLSEVDAAITNVEKKIANIKLSPELQQYQGFLDKAIADLKTIRLLRTQGIVLSSRHIQKEDDYALGFYSRAPPVNGILDNIPESLILANQVMDQVHNAQLEEYLLHEALCHLCPDHVIAKAITNKLYYDENYKDYPCDNGRLGEILRAIIDKEAQAAQTEGVIGLSLNSEADAGVKVLELLEAHKKDDSKILLWAHPKTREEYKVASKLGFTCSISLHDLGKLVSSEACKKTDEAKLFSEGHRHTVKFTRPVDLYGVQYPYIEFESVDESALRSFVSAFSGKKSQQLHDLIVTGQVIPVGFEMAIADHDGLIVLADAIGEDRARMEEVFITVKERAAAAEENIARIRVEQSYNGIMARVKELDAFIDQGRHEEVLAALTACERMRTIGWDADMKETLREAIWARRKISTIALVRTVLAELDWEKAVELVTATGPEGRSDKDISAFNDEVKAVRRASLERAQEGSRQQVLAEVERLMVSEDWDGAYDIVSRSKDPQIQTMAGEVIRRARVVHHEWLTRVDREKLLAIARQHDKITAAFNAALSEKKVRGKLMLLWKEYTGKLREMAEALQKISPDVQTEIFRGAQYDFNKSANPPSGLSWPLTFENSMLLAADLDSNPNVDENRHKKDAAARGILTCYCSAILRMYGEKPKGQNIDGKFSWVGEHDENSGEDAKLASGINEQTMRAVNSNDIPAAAAYLASGIRPFLDRNDLLLPIFYRASGEDNASAGITQAYDLISYLPVTSPQELAGHIDKKHVHAIDILPLRSGFTAIRISLKKESHFFAPFSLVETVDLYLFDAEDPMRPIPEEMVREYAGDWQKLLEMLGQRGESWAPGDWRLPTAKKDGSRPVYISPGGIDRDVTSEEGVRRLVDRVVPERASDERERIVKEMWHGPRVIEKRSAKEIEVADDATNRFVSIASYCRKVMRSRKEFPDAGLAGRAAKMFTALLREEAYSDMYRAMRIMDAFGRLVDGSGKLEVILTSSAKGPEMTEEEVVLYEQMLVKIIDEIGSWKDLSNALTVTVPWAGSVMWDKEMASKKEPSEKTAVEYRRKLWQYASDILLMQWAVIPPVPRNKGELGDDLMEQLNRVLGIRDPAVVDDPYALVVFEKMGYVPVFRKAALKEIFCRDESYSTANVDHDREGRPFISIRLNENAGWTVKDFAMIGTKLDGKAAELHFYIYDGDVLTVDPSRYEAMVKDGRLATGKENTPLLLEALMKNEARIVCGYLLNDVERFFRTLYGLGKRTSNDDNFWVGCLKKYQPKAELLDKQIPKLIEVRALESAAKLERENKLEDARTAVRVGLTALSNNVALEQEEKRLDQLIGLCGEMQSIRKAASKLGEDDSEALNQQKIKFASVVERAGSLAGQATFTAIQAQASRAIDEAGQRIEKAVRRRAEAAAKEKALLEEALAREAKIQAENALIERRTRSALLKMRMLGEVEQFASIDERSRVDTAVQALEAMVDASSDLTPQEAETLRGIIGSGRDTAYERIDRIAAALAEQRAAQAAKAERTVTFIKAISNQVKAIASMETAAAIDEYCTAIRTAITSNPDIDEAQRSALNEEERTAARSRKAALLIIARIVEAYGAIAADAEKITGTEDDSACKGLGDRMDTTLRSAPNLSEEPLCVTARKHAKDKIGAAWVRITDAHKKSAAAKEERAQTFTASIDARVQALAKEESEDSIRTKAAALKAEITGSDAIDDPAKTALIGKIDSQEETAIKRLASVNKAVDVLWDIATRAAAITDLTKRGDLATLQTELGQARESYSDVFDDPLVSGHDDTADAALKAANERLHTAIIADISARAEALMLEMDKIKQLTDKPMLEECRTKLTALEAEAKDEVKLTIPLKTARARFEKAVEAVDHDAAQAIGDDLDIASGSIERANDAAALAAIVIADDIGTRIKSIYSEHLRKELETRFNGLKAAITEKQKIFAMDGEIEKNLRSINSGDWLFNPRYGVLVRCVQNKTTAMDELGKMAWISRIRELLATLDNTVNASKAYAHSVEEKIKKTAFKVEMVRDPVKFFNELETRISAAKDGANLQVCEDDFKMVHALISANQRIFTEDVLAFTEQRSPEVRRAIAARRDALRQEEERLVQERAAAAVSEAKPIPGRIRKEAASTSGAVPEDLVEKPRGARRPKALKAQGASGTQGDSEPSTVPSAQKETPKPTKRTISRTEQSQYQAMMQQFVSETDTDKQIELQKKIEAIRGSLGPTARKRFNEMAARVSRQFLEGVERTESAEAPSDAAGCIYSPEGPKKAIIQMAENVKRGEVRDARSDKVNAAIVNIEKKIASIKLSPELQQYQGFLDKAMADLKTIKLLRTQGVVLSSRDIQKEDDYALGFYSRAPPVNGILDNIPESLILANQVMDQVYSAQLEEYLLHEALCHLCPDHAIAKAITNKLYYDENYKDYPYDNGRLGVTLRTIINKEAQAATAQTASAPATASATASAKEIDFGRERKVASDFYDEIVSAAQDANDKGHKLVIGIDTGWIPNMSGCQGVINYLEQDLLEHLRRRGLDVEIVRGTGDGVAQKLTAMHNAAPDSTDVIAICGKDMLKSPLYQALPGVLIGVDGASLKPTSAIRIIEMCLIALRLASGTPAEQVKNEYIDVTPVVGRVLTFIFTPTEPYDMEQFRKVNDLQIREIKTKA